MFEKMETTEKVNAKLIGIKDNKVTIEFTLDAPSPANRSKGDDGVTRNGKNFVLCYAKGTLPVGVGGNPIKWDAKFMVKA